MPFTFDENQKKAIKQYNEIKSSKPFVQFLENMKDLVDPEKTPIMKQSLKNRQVPQRFSRLPAQNNVNEEYSAITPDDLLARIKFLVDEISRDTFPEDHEFNDEAERNKAFDRTNYIDLLKDTVMVFNDKYQNFMVDGIEDKVFAEKESLETYRAFKLGRSIVDEISKISQKMLEEKRIYDKIDNEKNTLDKEKTTYDNNQKKLSHEIEVLGGGDKDSYHIGSYEANGVKHESVVIKKEDIKKDPLYFADNNNKFDQLMSDLNSNFEAERQKWIKRQKDEESRYVKKADKINREYYGKKETIEDEYSLDQTQFDELEKKLRKEQKFDEIKEYNDLQKAIDEALKYPTDKVADDYKRNTFMPDRKLWETDLDRDSVNEYKEDLDEINQQIEYLEKEVKKDSVWLETARPAYESAKKAAEMGDHIDEVIEDKTDLIAAQTAKIAQLTQDVTKGKVVFIADIPESAFSTAELGKLGKKAEQEYLKFLGTQRGFTATLDKMNKGKGFDKVIKDLNGIVEAFDKMEYFPRKDSVGLGLTPEFIEELKIAATENNPKDPDKTDATRRFGIINGMLASYKMQLDDALNEKLEQLDAKIADIDKQETNRDAQIADNLEWIKALKAAPDKFKKEHKDNLAKKEEELKERLDQLKKEREDAIKQAEYDYEKEYTEYKASKKDGTVKTKYPNGTKPMEGSRNFAIDRAKDNYTRAVKAAESQFEIDKAALKTTLDNGLKDAKKDLEERIERDKENRGIIAEYKKSNAEEKKRLENEKEEAKKAFENLHGTVDKYKNGEFSKLSNDLNDSLVNIREYLGTIHKIYEENEKVRQDNLVMLEKIPALKAKVAEEIREKRIQKAFTEEGVVQIELDINKRQETLDTNTASLEYLKVMKKSYETGRAWCERKSKLKHIDDKKDYDRLKNSLAERDKKLTELEKEYKQKVKSNDESYEEDKRWTNEIYDSRRERIEEQKKTVQQAINDTAHIKRTLKNLKGGAQKMVDAKKAVNDGITQEKEILKARYTNQYHDYSETEDKLMTFITTSKKKYGFSSPVFRELKDEIEAYRDAKNQVTVDSNNPLSPEEAEAYKTRTEKLLKSIDKYIKKRFDPKDPEKKTREGQVRLDAVMDLKACILRQQKNLDTYKADLESIENKRTEINVKPKSELELKYLKMEDLGPEQPKPEKNLASEFLDKGEELGENIVLTEDEKVKFAKEDADLDDREEKERKKEIEKLAKENIEKGLKEQEKLTDKYIRDEHAKEVEIPVVEFSGEFFKDLEKNIKNIPEDLWPVTREFNALMSQVPADYGFEAFNKGKWFFNKVKLADYKKNHTAFEMFMKDKDLVKSFPAPEDVKRVKAFDKEMAKHVNADTLGYREYFEEQINANPDADPMTREEFLMGKFNLKNHEEVVKFLVEKRREAAPQYGLVDPRTTIKNYGTFMNVDGFVQREAQTKINQAKAASDMREKIIKEIDNYDKKIASVKPGYGFKDYVKEKNILPLEEYMKSGMGTLRYQMAKKITSPKIKYKKYVGEWTPEMKKELEEYNQLMEKNRAFEYKEAYKEYEAQVRKEYEASGKAKEAYLLKNPKLIDPRIKYADFIRQDGILLQMYKPEAVDDLSNGQYYSMSQLIEDSLPEDYEKNALEIINKDRKYKDLLNETSTDILSQKPNFKGIYFEGFDKYPDDLQEKIREFDMIMATVPDDYGYASFERDVDFTHRFSRDEYIKNGYGKAYYCQLHQMVNPRIDLKKAKQIRDFDIVVGKLDGEAHKAWEKYNSEKTNKKLGFEEYKTQVYGEEQLKIDAQKVRDEYCTKFNETDPRESVPNYGRIVLNKAEFEAVRKPIFNDNERIERNKQILEEMKSFVEKLKPIPDDYGFEEFKKGDRIEGYVTRREYKMTDEGVRKYLIDKKIENPIHKYSKYISIDSQLKRQINEVTKEYRNEMEQKRKGYAAEPETDPLFAKREEEREKTKAELDKLEKDIKTQGDGHFAENVKWVERRRQYRQIKDDILKYNIGKRKDVLDLEEKIGKLSDGINENLNADKDRLSKENIDAQIELIHVKRYCEQLTIDNIESEEKAFETFEMIESGQENVWGQKTFVPISNSERYALGLRQQRVAELKQLKSALEELEKTKPDLAKEIKADPQRMDNLMEKIRSQNKSKAKSNNQPENSRVVNSNPDKQPQQKVNEQEIAAPSQGAVVPGIGH